MRKNKRVCPVCKETIFRSAIWCVYCGKRFTGGRREAPEVIVRRNTGMSPSAAIMAFAPVLRTKSAMAHDFGIRRNSLNKLIDRFGLQHVEFSGYRRAA